MHTTILGAGVAGLSTSFHLNHEDCSILERDRTWGGHAKSVNSGGFILDQGPHVSFTTHEYVRNLLYANVEGRINDFPARIRNYYNGSWIEHPAQAHLWQFHEPCRSKFADDMLAAVKNTGSSPITNFKDWLDCSYGASFSNILSTAYNEKYWTVNPSMLSTDWLGPRMPVLLESQVTKSLVPDTYQSINYITQVRYPKNGGFQNFFQALAHNSKINFGCDISSIDLSARTLSSNDGTTYSFENLVSTIPLNIFIGLCTNCPTEVREAASSLDCTQLLLIDVFVPTNQQIEGNWFYIYDRDKISTRIHIIERLSPTNCPEGWTGLQVEVYFSKYKPFQGNYEEVKKRVFNELVTMGFIDDRFEVGEKCIIESRWVPFANIMFTHSRKSALDCIFDWLTQFGLHREEDDLDYNTDWSRERQLGTIAMAGRFAQWKYYWTDDCVLRGRSLANSLRQ